MAITNIKSIFATEQPVLGSDKRQIKELTTGGIYNFKINYSFSPDSILLDFTNGAIISRGVEAIFNGTKEFSTLTDGFIRVKHTIKDGEFQGDTYVCSSEIIFTSVQDADVILPPKYELYDTLFQIKDGRCITRYSSKIKTILSLESLGISDTDFPGTEDTDAFVNFLGDILPNHSKLMLHTGANTNISKNFPFQSFGQLEVTKTSFQINVKYVIQGCFNTVPTLGMESVKNDQLTKKGDIWELEASLGGTWSTNGYVLTNQNPTIFTTKDLPVAAININAQFEKFDTFIVSMRTNTDEVIYAQTKVQYYDIGREKGQSSVLVSNSGVSSAVSRGFTINETSFSLRPQRVEGTTSTRALKYEIVATKENYYKNSKPRR